MNFFPLYSLQMDHGRLLGCFSTMFGSRYCLVRLLEEITTDEATLLNSFDCPLINLTNIIYCVPSTFVSHSVSIVHQCTDSCKISRRDTIYQVEQEQLKLPSLVYTHDWSNTMYCLNVYFMSQ